MEKGMAISALIPFGGDASTNGMYLEKTRIRRRSSSPSAETLP